MAGSFVDADYPARRQSADFWKFWAGQTISNLGSSITLLALPLLIFELTGSPLNLALASASYFVPYLLFGLIIGAWTDRVDRKRLMIVTDIARALVIASIPLLGALDLLSAWWIYGVQFVGSTLSICFDAAQFAAIPSLVSRKDLVTANGRIQASYSAASVIGPLLAGLLAAAMPIHTILVLDSLSFLISAFSLALIGMSFNVRTESDARTAQAGAGVAACDSSFEDRASSRASLRGDIVEGLRYVLGHPVLRSISIMMALVNFLSSTVYAQLVFFAKERLQASDAELGVLYAAGSIGVIVLSLAAGRLRERLSFSSVALGPLMLEGLLTVLLALTSTYWIAVAVWGLHSGVSILFNINTSSLRQTIAPSYLLGRVVSIAGVLAWSAIPAGTLVGGFVIEQTKNVALVYGVIGALVFLIAVGFSFTAVGHAERYVLEGRGPLGDAMSPPFRADY